MKYFFFVVLLSGTVNAQDLSSSTFMVVKDTEPVFSIPASTGPYIIGFYVKEKEIGRLILSPDGLEFKGKAKKSALIFFDYLKNDLDAYLKNRNQ